MDRWKGKGGKSQRGEEQKSRREKIRVRGKKEWEERRCRCAKRWESRETLCSSTEFVAPERQKVGLLKRRVQSHLARWGMKSCTPLWRKAHVEVKIYKTHNVGSWDVETGHAVVARSTVGSQNVQNTPGSDHFWKFKCRKSARRCGTKHISKSKCTKHHMFAPLLDVEASFCVAGARDSRPF